MLDPAGNLLSQTQGTSFEAARTQGNRLLFNGDRHCDYDEFGRLAAERRGKGQRLLTRYEYDCQHQLICAELPSCRAAELPGGRRVRYDYDAFGRRIRKTMTDGGDEQVIEFLWQANNLIAENRSDGTYRSFIYEPGNFKPLVQLEGEGEQAEVYHYQLDHLGTPLGLTNVPGQCPPVSTVPEGVPLSQRRFDEILKTPKGERPAPEVYLPSAYIDAHLAQFDNGATRFMIQSNLEKYGIGQRDGTSFVMPSVEADRLLYATHGNARGMEDALGLPNGFLESNHLVRVEINAPANFNIIIPSGNEAGENELWIPGGKLPDGNNEAIIDVKTYSLQITLLHHWHFR